MKNNSVVICDCQRPELVASMGMHPTEADSPPVVCLDQFEQEIRVDRAEDHYTRDRVPLAECDQVRVSGTLHRSLFSMTQEVHAYIPEGPRRRTGRTEWRSYRRRPFGVCPECGKKHEGPWTDWGRSGRIHVKITGGG